LTEDIPVHKITLYPVILQKHKTNITSVMQTIQQKYVCMSSYTLLILHGMLYQYETG